MIEYKWSPLGTAGINNIWETEETISSIMPLDKYAYCMMSAWQVKSSPRIHTRALLLHAYRGENTQVPMIILDRNSLLCLKTAFSCRSPLLIHLSCLLSPSCVLYILLTIPTTCVCVLYFKDVHLNQLAAVKGQ